MVSKNPELQLAADFVQYTDRNIFLTGKAGTGKTTFLHNLREQTPKRMIVTAPTGVAAINAGGVTLHSFFQLPFGPHIPGSDGYDRNSKRQFRFSKEKKQIIQSLDLLVIDEISMVRADLLDSVDAVLRRHRHSNQPFGGVQLLMIGDLHQLSPVARQEEWALLKPYYDSVYFFSSSALAKTELQTIELKHIYRQSDPEFIRLLNSVRENRLDGATLAELNERHIPQFKAEEDQGYITLTTHNASAESINQTQLQELEAEEYQFSADISGDFPEHIFPTPAQLLLKEGAQVMFMRNDLSPDKRYFNGKIGKISRIIGKTILVSCPTDDEEIEVNPVSWENIKYTINAENKEIAEEIVGKFEQYPLKLAWAITIHKSQGLTFERAIIDARDAFTHGQVYVALSRCKTLEGMVLSSPLSGGGVDTDPAVLGFDREGLQNPPSEALLQAAKMSYQQKLLLDCFDFGLLRKRLGYLVYLLSRNSSVVQLSGGGDLQQLDRRAGEEIFAVSENFKRELGSIFAGSATLPEEDSHTLERIKKGSAWFQTKLVEIVAGVLDSLDFETDNKELRKKITNVLANSRKEYGVKLAGIQAVSNGFSPTAYLHALAAAEIDFEPPKVKKKKGPAYSEEDIDHPELFESLREWRTAKASELDIARFQILYQRVLIQIVVCLPKSKAELLQLPGVGKKTVEKYGEELLEIVCSYREKHGIESVSLPEPKAVPEEKKLPAKPTKEITLDLAKQGKSVAVIAKERGLAESTIEAHLCHLLRKGTLGIDTVLTGTRQQSIEAELGTDEEGGLTAVKERLGDEFSYGEIRMMLAHLSSLQAKDHSDENQQ